MTNDRPLHNQQSDAIETSDFDRHFVLRSNLKKTPIRLSSEKMFWTAAGFLFSRLHPRRCA